MKLHINSDMEVKASGDIRNYKDTISIIEAGATSIGASTGISIVSDTE